MFENEKLYYLKTDRTAEQLKAINIKKDREQKFRIESNKIKSKYNYLILRLLINERKKIWVGLWEFEYDSEEVGEREIERGFESRKNSL